jgi:hypothetical protein
LVVARTPSAGATARPLSRISLDDLTEPQFTARILAALKHGALTTKALANVCRGVRHRPAYYRALESLEASGAITQLPPGQRERKHHWHLRENVKE